MTARYSTYGIWFTLNRSFQFTSGGTGGGYPVDYNFTVSGNWNRCGPGGLGSGSETETGNGSRVNITIRDGVRRLKTFSVSASATYECEDTGATIPTGTATVSA